MRRLPIAHPSSARPNRRVSGFAVVKNGQALRIKLNPVHPAESDRNAG